MTIGIGTSIAAAIPLIWRIATGTIVPSSCTFFYLNKPVINIIYWLTAGGLGIWMIIDLFRIPGMVKDRNKAIIKEAIEEAKKLYPEV